MCLISHVKIAHQEGKATDRDQNLTRSAGDQYTSVYPISIHPFHVFSRKCTDLQIWPFLQDNISALNYV